MGKISQIEYNGTSYDLCDVSATNKIDTHIADTGAHVTAAEKETWNGNIAKVEEIEEAIAAKEPLIRITTEVTPSQVLTAIMAGRPVAISHTDNVYGEMAFNYFAVNDLINGIVASINFETGGVVFCAQLDGSLADNSWSFTATALAKASDIPEVPTNVSQLTNDSGYITNINEDDVIEALGYLPAEMDTQYQMQEQDGLLKLVETNGVSTFATDTETEAPITIDHYSSIVAVDSDGHLKGFRPVIYLDDIDPNFRLPISKGGTNATTATGALQNLGLTATATEINYCDGVTSNIQTQIDALLAKIAELETALENKQDKINTFGDLSGSEVVNVAEEGA